MPSPDILQLTDEQRIVLNRQQQLVHRLQREYKRESEVLNALCAMVLPPNIGEVDLALDLQKGTITINPKIEPEDPDG